MKQMQDFRACLTAAHKTPTPHQRRMFALTRLDRDQLNSLVAFVPWFFWSSESAPDAG